MFKTPALAFAAAFAVAAPSSALAQSTTDIPAKTPNSAYLQDGHGAIVHSGSGMCWRAGYWTPADAVLGCDGDLLPPVVNAIAPPIVMQQSEVVQPMDKAIPPLPVTHCDFSFTLESDQTFKFNSAELGASAKGRINDLIRNKFAACGHIDKIIVSGYTDHLGTDQLNHSLSLKRAAAVATYLVQSGVQAPIEQRGMGKQQELKACKGIRLLRKLIECLAPNRRVEIEVKGVK